MTYEIDTTILPGDRIQQRVLYQLDGVMQELSRQVVFTQDEQVRAALVKLGWTPPIVAPR